MCVYTNTYIHLTTNGKRGHKFESEQTKGLWGREERNDVIMI